MKKLYTAAFLFVLISSNFAQQKIAVASFRALTSQDARIAYPVKDSNGRTCAIIKVETSQTGFVFDFGLIGNAVKTEQKTGAIWVWVPAGARKVTINHQKLGGLYDYPFPEDIQDATDYLMVLTTGKVITTIDETISYKILIITSIPSGAKVYINDQYKGRTPFQEEMIDGEYKYRVDKGIYYEPEIGNVNLTTEKEKKQIVSLLKPKFGFAYISTKPEEGMTINIDGKELYQTTPTKTDTLLFGKHTITVNKNFYNPQTKEVIILENKIDTIEFLLKPAFGSLNLQCVPEPESGAGVSIDGKPTGLRTPCKLDRLMSGKHTIELQNEWYEPKTSYVVIEDGIDLKKTVELKPNFSIVHLNSDSQSELYIDTELKGNGKWEGKLKAGLHTFEAKKNKHNTSRQKINFEIGEEKSITLTPDPIVGKLKIFTNAIGAAIKLNGIDYGTTPRVISDLFTGNYKLTLEKEGYRKFYKNIVIEEGKTTEVNDTLFTGLKVNIQSSPLGAQLFVDNKEIGKTPLTIMLNIGNHKVKLINGKKVVEESITVSEGGNTTFTYDVNEVVPVAFNGSLGKNSVEIDGNYAGEIPLTTKLNIGTHSIKIEKGNEVLEKQIIVTSDGKNEFNFTARDFIKSFYKKHFLSVSYAYHQTTLANTTFAERISNGSITRDYGHAATISYNLYPLEITATAFSSGFRTHNLAPFNDNAAITHQGIELSLDYMPINIGSSVFPYIGAGYQLSQVYSAAGSMTIEGAASINTSMPVVKGGLKVKLGNLFLFGEYKQTFPLNGSSYNSQQLSAGLGWTF